MFELSLNGILPLIGSVIIGCCLIWIHKKQQERQNSIDSATFIHKLLSSLDTTGGKEFRELYHAIDNNENLTPLQRYNALSYPAIMDRVALFFYNGTMTKKHVKDFFYAHIERCGTDVMQAILKEARKEQPNNYIMINELVKDFS